MVHKITMPDAGQTTDELMITRWLKKVGDTVDRGDILLEVETDKATVTVESFAKGKLLKRLAEEGEKAIAGAVIAWVGEEKDLEAEGKPAIPVPAAKVPEAAAAPATTSVLAATPKIGPNGVRASPAARKAARELALDLALVFASLGGKVVKRADVLAYGARMKESFATQAPVVKGPLGDPAPFKLLAASRIRKTIAARMVESVTTIPAFTLEVEVDMTRAKTLRDELNAKLGEVRIAYHDLVARCVAVAAKKHGLVNASYRDDGIHLYQSVNVGLAVAREEGLVVPVVRGVDGKSLAVIARENAENIAAVRGGNIRPDVLEGGTITISNLGMFPIRRFTAVINPPQSCIVALGTMGMRPVWCDGGWAARPLLTMTVSFDHRVMDGAYGATFLKDLQELLERPTMLLL